VTEDSFFDQSSDQSQVKSQIVAKYFWAWAKVVIPQTKKHANKIAYIDLFAGPGVYKDGTKSTPLLVLERAIQEPDMRQMLVTVFNDRDPDNVRALKENIAALPGIRTLKYSPRTENEEVGERIVKFFEQTHLVPTLLFVDPWGYKGLSLRLIGSVLKDWGCDCILFFNYLRINMGLNNPAVQEHMNALFGEARANQLRCQLEPTPPAVRELTVVEASSQALKEAGGEFFLPFFFKNDRGTRTSHHLIFVTKSVVGYTIMKDIMAKESSGTEQGVASFEYSPATADQPLLFALSRPLDDLADMLLDEFAGCTMTMLQVFYEHHIGRPYVAANYKQVLSKLEAEGKITVDPPAERRQKRKGVVTFADTVRITFPLRSKKQI